MKEGEITSLKSDLNILERENFELRARFESNKAPGQISRRTFHLTSRDKGDLRCALTDFPHGSILLKPSKDSIGQTSNTVVQAQAQAQGDAWRYLVAID